MLHTKFQGYWSAGFENIFKGLLPYMGVAAMLVLGPGGLEQLGAPRPLEAT